MSAPVAPAERLRPPDYAGAGFVNLIAELELRLTGRATFSPLRADLSAAIPGGTSYLLVVFDGLGSAQLDHPQAAPLAAARRADLDATFPSTTTTALASLSTGLPPSHHGLLGYELWMPELGLVANTIHWTEVGGDALDIDHAAILPAPNLWERLAASGVEAVTVQPAHFDGSPLSRMLYRGARFEGVETYDELVVASTELARVPKRLVVTYLADVDVTAHRHGQRSDQYAEAMARASHVWEWMSRRIAPGVVLVGTADHGHMDLLDRRRLPEALEAATVVFGDGRAMFTLHDASTHAAGLNAGWVDRPTLEPLFGPPPLSVGAAARMPAGALLAGAGTRLLHRHSDPRMIGAHGGLEDGERRVPLLVA